MENKKKKKNDELIVDVEDFENFGKLTDDDEYKEDEIEETKNKSNKEIETNDELEEVSDDDEIVDDEEEYEEVSDDDFEEVGEDDEIVDDEEDAEEYEEVSDDDFEEVGEDDEIVDDEEDAEEYEEASDDDFEEVDEDDEIVDDEEDAEEYEEVSDDDDFEEVGEDDEIVDDEEDAEEYEEVSDDDFEEIGEDDEIVNDEEDAEKYEEASDDDFEEVGEDDEIVDDEEDAEEYEEASDDDFEEVGDDDEIVDDEEDAEEYEEASDDDFEEVGEDDEIVDDEEDAEEYEEVSDDDFEEVGEDDEIVDDEEDAEEYEEASDDDFEEVDDEDEKAENDDEIEEFEDVDEEDEEIAEDDEPEEYEDIDEEEEETAEDDEPEEFEDVDEEDEEIAEDDEPEEYEDIDEEDEETAEDDEPEEYEDVDEEDEETAEDDEPEEYEDVDEEDEEYEDTEEDEEDEEESGKDAGEETEEVEETENKEEPMRFADDEEPKEEEEDDDDDDDEDEEEEESIYPDELIDLELECVYIGLLFNNPKAISRFYLLFEDCKFSDNELYNLYRIIIFRDGEAYAPAIAKDKFQLPRENPRTYDLKYKVRKMAIAKKYDLEEVYTELKKLFILKKNYLIAPTSAIQQQILDIQNYDLYKDMTVEEVESAIEQIAVTTGLSRAVLNEDATSYLLSDDNELSNGISLPFPTLTTVFKGIRKGETMTYAMPSNSGKSRLTIDLACYIAFVHKKKVLVISNEMSQEKMRLCMITTILNNPEIQKLHKQNVRKTEGELLELKFRPDPNKRIKCDENGYILRKPDETMEEFAKRLKKNSKEFNQTIAATEWLNTQINNSIYFIHITEHSNDDLKKIIMNYYYKEAIEYIFYDTLKADTENIGNGNEIKKTATILSNLAQKFKMWIGSSMQLLESSTLPVNLTINDMSASKTVKEVLDTLCLMKQISRQTLYKYEYSETDQFEKCHDIKVPKDTDVRFYACVVDKNRAGAKPTLLFRLNLAYNEWEEMGHLRLKQSELEED